jgi:hypothetical protein
VEAKPLSETADLRYLEAHSVRCRADSLSDFRVCTEDAQPLGSVECVLIRPSSGRLEYFVVESPGLFLHRHYLVPAGAGAVVQEDPKTLRITARKDELNLQTFKPHSVPGLSDADLLTTAFTKDAA